MNATTPDDPTAELRTAIAAERRELAELLGRLPDHDWERPSLCAGWRVRDVVAHVSMPFRYSTPRFVAELARSGFRFNAMSDRCARRDAAALTPDQLTAALRDNAGHPWKPPGGGYAGALSHDVIHGLDMTVALGLDRSVPPDRLRHVLAGSASAKARRYFGVDLDGVQLCADDLDWTLGSGVPLRGAAQHLLLVVCGRTLPPGLLHGAAADRFSQA